MNNPLFFDSTDLFSHMFSPRERVYVVSDSQYKAAQKAQAERQIQTLEARAADYQRNLDVVQATITELKTEHGLLPATNDEAPNWLYLMTHTIAIGDVHGCYNLLLNTVEKHIGSGNELVLLGDLFDRSPEPDGDLNVLEFVRDMNEHPDAYGLSAVECLMGNHESLLLDALEGDVNCWLANGGNVEFAIHLIENPSHVEWIKQRPSYLIRNKHLLVHAGVKPNVPLDAQDPFDLCWIRPDPHVPHNLPYTIIHGHTIHDQVTHYPDRIAIDTGAFHTGVLSTYSV